MIMIFTLFLLKEKMADKIKNDLVTLGRTLVKRRVGKHVLEDRPRSEATTSTSRTSSMTLAATQESVVRLV